MYETSDIDTASALMASGHKLLGVGRSEDSKKSNTIFRFDSEGVEEDVIKYLNDGIQVDARTILTRFRELKNLAHNKNFSGEW